MTREEFNTWLDDLGEKMPATGDWVKGLSSNSQTVSSWFDVAFSGFGLDEAIEVTQQIVTGSVELGRFPSDWQEIPQVFRQAVSENRLARLEHNRKQVPDDFGDYRVKCLDCRDTGFVTCWSLDAMHRARQRLKDERVEQKWTECGVACHCSAGDRYGAYVTKRGRDTIREDVARHDAEKWIKLDRKKDAEDRQKLLDWAANYQTVPPNDFGEYSQQDF